MRRIIVVLSIICILCILASGVWAGEKWNAYQTGRKARQIDAETQQFNEDVDNLFYALQQYKERVGSYPVGNNAEVAAALMGNNPKHLIILVGRKRDLDTKGQIVDPWGTPLRIYFSGEGVLVRSAGPNQRFDDSTVPNSDDYYRSN